MDQARLAEHLDLCATLVEEVVQASPSMAPRLREITALIADGKYYQALKLARQLIAYEEELIGHVALQS